MKTDLQVAFDLFCEELSKTGHLSAGKSNLMFAHSNGSPGKFDHFKIYHSSDYLDPSKTVIVAESTKSVEQLLEEASK